MRWMVLLALVPGTAAADGVVAARTIRALSVIAPGDVVLSAADLPGAIPDPAQAWGLEARVTIYAGRPVRAADLANPALVERNQIVPLVFRAGGLVIATEGRALGRGGQGDSLRVMNLASRSVVTGRVEGDGSVQVGDRP